MAQESSRQCALHTCSGGGIATTCSCGSAMASAAVGASGPAPTTDVLFRTIEEWHLSHDGNSSGNTPTAWSEADVLDAGTGRSSLRWLVHSVQPRNITAVTADPSRAASLRKEFGTLGSSGGTAPTGCNGHQTKQCSHARGGEILVGSWVPSSELPLPPLAPGAAYDVVSAPTQSNPDLQRLFRR